MIILNECRVLTLSLGQLRSLVVVLVVAVVVVVMMFLFLFS